jgi:predicted TIM-barrel fold metal-dependent hydrolase
MKRRDALGLLSAAAAMPLMALPAEGQGGVRRIGIDAHTHIFNIADLPWAAFLWQVQARQFEETIRARAKRDDARLLAHGFLAVLTSIFMRSVDRLVGEEVPGPDVPLAERFSRGASLELFLASLAETLRELYFEPEAFERRYFPPFSGDYIAVGESLSAIEIDRAAAAAAIRDEINKQVGEALPGEGQEKPWYAWAGALLNDNTGWLSDGLGFGLRLTSSPADNLDLLFEHYADREGPALVAAALVDFAGWLNQEPPISIVEQIRRMDDLQGSTPPGMLMQMIVPFNPWRQVAVVRGRAMGPSPLEFIAEAVQARGAIGVKLYPPMGFVPMGNADPQLSFPQRAEELLGPDFAAGFDEALTGLYKLCVELDIPILTHTADSNEAGVDFGKRAHPDNWVEVLSDPRFATLRICMAHFGGFAAEPPTDTAAASHVSVAMQHAERVFVDLAYLSRVLPFHEEGGNRDTAITGLQTTLAGYPDFASQIVFGSDWHMLSKEPWHEHYPTLIEQYLGDGYMAVEDIERVFAANSLRLFRLLPGMPGHDRLRAYYQARGTAHFQAIEALGWR